MIGLSELVLIIVVIIAIVRPDKLAEYMQGIRSAMQSARDIQNEARAVVDLDAVQEGAGEPAESVKEAE